MHVFPHNLIYMTNFTWILIYNPEKVVRKDNQTCPYTQQIRAIQTWFPFRQTSAGTRSSLHIIKIKRDATKWCQKCDRKHRLLEFWIHYIAKLRHHNYLRHDQSGASRGMLRMVITINVRRHFNATKMYKRRRRNALCCEKNCYQKWNKQIKLYKYKLRNIGIVIRKNKRA